MVNSDKSVLFIDNSESDFTGDDLNSVKVRGTESSLILLAESFVKKNIYEKYTSFIYCRYYFFSIICCFCYIFFFS